MVTGNVCVPCARQSGVAYAYEALLLLMLLLFQHFARCPPFKPSLKFVSRAQRSLDYLGKKRTFLYVAPLPPIFRTRLVFLWTTPQPFYGLCTFSSPLFASHLPPKIRINIWNFHFSSVITPYQTSLYPTWKPPEISCSFIDLYSYPLPPQAQGRPYDNLPHVLHSSSLVCSPWPSFSGPVVNSAHKILILCYSSITIKSPTGGVRVVG